MERVIKQNHDAAAADRAASPALAVWAAPRSTAPHNARTLPPPHRCCPPPPISRLTERPSPTHPPARSRGPSLTCWSRLSAFSTAT